MLSRMAVSCQFADMLTFPQHFLISLRWQQGNLHSGDWTVKIRTARVDLRREDRYRVLFRARLREQGHTAMEVQITNLSVHGFCCKASFMLQIGHVVWMTIPGLEHLEATVIWEDGFYFGCEFERPLHVAVFDHVAKNFGFY
jgi:hypothetical protein